MKLILVCLFGLVGLSLALPQFPTSSRGCRYIMGKCVEECPEGTHAYTTGCGYLTREATCDIPNPVPDTTGMMCDFSSCYCDSPTVRDTKSGKCVSLDNCPGK